MKKEMKLISPQAKISLFTS